MLTKDFAPYYILLIVFADYWTSLLRDPFTTNFFFAADTFLNFTKQKSEKKVDTDTRDCEESEVKDFNISFEKTLFPSSFFFFSPK